MDAIELKILEWAGMAIMAGISYLLKRAIDQQDKKINDLKNLLNENLVNENLDFKNPINFFKNLPFVRLVKTNIFK